GIFSTYWSSNYATVQRVNLLIDKVQAAALSAEIKEKLIAEARFLRAYAYFNLVRVFGGVPLDDKSVALSETYTVPRATEEAVLALVIAALQEAAKLDGYRTTEERNLSGGRATSVAANTLLAKAYLWKRDFAAAEGVLAEVVNSGKS